jgi:nucleotide-binding universal stress UspA family protein
MPSAALLPASALKVIRQEAARLEAERRKAARDHLETAARLLAGTRWKVSVEVGAGVPLDEMLDRATTARAHTLVLGARGVGGLERLLLGSVAEGALTRAAIPVLIVR